MSLALGSVEGLVKIFDIRFMNKPTLEFQHQYRKPIKKYLFDSECYSMHEPKISYPLTAKSLRFSIKTQGRFLPISNPNPISILYNFN